jgi:hypothetical protein
LSGRNDSVGQDINRIFFRVDALSNALDDDGNPDQLIAGEPRQFEVEFVVRSWFEPPVFKRLGKN